jgi:DNA-binding PadR family transcriptional regulator
MVITRVIERQRLSDREKLIILEIERDRIDTANSFVDYISEAYAFSKSSVWHNLNRLKERGFLDFATKEEKGKELQLTRKGLGELQQLGKEKAELSRRFSMEYAPQAQYYASGGFYADGNGVGYRASAGYRTGGYG